MLTNILEQFSLHSPQNLTYSYKLPTSLFKILEMESSSQLQYLSSDIIPGQFIFPRLPETLVHPIRLYDYS